MGGTRRVSGSDRGWKVHSLVIDGFARFEVIRAVSMKIQVY